MSDPEPPTSMLPATCFVGAITWKAGRKVKEAIQGMEIPPGTSPNRLYVSKELRGLVIQLAQISLISCHPGVHRTMFHIKERFWWPDMRKEVAEYIAACSVCAQNKTSNRPPGGLLRPLPVTLRRWSDISLDFVTGLSTSEGNTVVFTVVNRFSKMVKLFEFMVSLGTSVGR